MNKRDVPHFGENIDYDFHRLLNEHERYVARAGERLSIPVEIKDGVVYIPSFTIESVVEPTRWQRLLRWLKRWIETH